MAGDNSNLTHESLEAQSKASMQEGGLYISLTLYPTSIWALLKTADIT